MIYQSNLSEKLERCFQTSPISGLEDANSLKATNGKEHTQEEEGLRWRKFSSPCGRSFGRIFMWGLILVDVDSCLRETNLGSKWTSSWVVFVVNCLQISWLQPFCNPHLLVNGCHGGTPLETSMEPTSLQMWISPHFYRWYTLKLVQISSPHWVFTKTMAPTHAPIQGASAISIFCRAWCKEKWLSWGWSRETIKDRIPGMKKITGCVPAVYTHPLCETNPNNSGTVSDAYSK